MNLLDRLKNDRYATYSEDTPETAAYVKGWNDAMDHASRLVRDHDSGKLAAAVPCARCGLPTGKTSDGEWRCWCALGGEG